MAKVWPPQGADSPSFAFKAICCCEVKGPLVFLLEWQNKSALHSACGFPGNSGGVHYYKSKAWSGALHSDFYDFCGDGGTKIDEFDETYGGSHTKSLEQGGDDESGHFVACACVGDLTYNGDSVDDAASCTDNPIFVNTANPTDNSSGDDFNQLSGTGECLTPSGVGIVTTGTAREQWSDETFFTDNIAACDAQPWDVADIFWGGTSDTFLGAGYAQWVDSGGWTAANAYDPARFRFHQNHLIPGQDYTFSIEAWRATYDGVTTVIEADFSLFATIEVDVTADSAGEIHVDPTDIPNADGFITMLKYSTISVVPA